MTEPRALLTVGGPVFFAGDVSGHNVVAFTADGDLFTPYSDRAALIARDTGRPRRWIHATPSDYHQLWALDPTGRFALHASSAAPLERVDLATGERASCGGFIAVQMAARRAIVRVASTRAIADRALLIVAGADAAWVRTDTWEAERVLEGSSARFGSEYFFAHVFSDDGRLLVAASQQRAELFDLRSGAHLATYSSQAKPLLAAMVVGDRVLLARGDALVTLDAQTGELLDERVFPASSDTQTSYGPAQGALFLEHGARVALWYLGRGLRVLDVDTLGEVSVARGSFYPAYALEGPDRTLWLQGYDGALEVIDLASAKAITPRPRGAARALAFEADGAHLVVAHSGAVVDRVRLSDGSVTTVAGPEHQTHMLTLSPLGTVARFDRRTDIHAASGLVEARNIATEHAVYGEGSRAASAVPNGVRVEPEGVVVTVEGFASKVADGALDARFSRDGRWLAAKVGPNLAVIDLGSHTVRGTAKVSASFRLTVTDGGVAGVLSHAKVTLFGALPKPVNLAIAGTSGGALSIAPDGAFAAVGLFNGELELIDLAKPKRRARVTICGGPVRAVAYSGDGARLAVVGDDNRVQVFESASLYALLPRVK
jgi:WD40 repeat protein